MADQQPLNEPGKRSGPEYYSSLGHWSISESIKDLDDPQNYDEFNRYVTSARSKNFIVDFNDEEAWCGFDLDADAYSALFKKSKPPELHTRWINIWLPHEQKDTLAAVARHYEFTPRLLGFMCSPPLKQTKSNINSKSSLSSLFRRSNNRNNSSSSSEKGLDKSSPPASDMASSLGAEENIGMTDMRGSSQPDFTEALNPYFLANEIWHYSSVDWGRRYVCLGYNTIHNIPIKPQPGGIEEHLHDDRPHGKRIWTWLLLCEDKTVITVSEDPYPYRNCLLTQHEQLCLGITRRNLINTFRQLSKAPQHSNEPAQMQLPLRTRLGDTEEETAHRPTDIPGLLFYYLFDDWFNTYSLIARREHRYAAELNKLRINMLTKAELSHVDRLHHIGRQLGMLKRIYESYDLIIDRVLEKQEPSLASLKNSHFLSHGGTSAMQSPMEQSMAQLPAQVTESHLLGVSISSAARVRFERLKHRIRLYALSEVQECLDQKDSLVMMNFNLIAIKESYSVERLTRITLLLAKVTMLFMPVSLMTAYFSTQLKDVQFTVRGYWAWFAGILAASVLGLVVFSLASGTLEGKMLYKPLGRRVVDLARGHWRRRKMKGAVGDVQE